MNYNTNYKTLYKRRKYVLARGTEEKDKLSKDYPDEKVLIPKKEPYGITLRKKIIGTKMRGIYIKLKDIGDGWYIVFKKNYGSTNKLDCNFSGWAIKYKKKANEKYEMLVRDTVVDLL